MYRLTDLTKRYRGRREVIALREVELEVPTGQFLAIQGPTGGGKSTLLQMLGALDRPTRGTISLDDVDLARLGDRRLAELRARRLGFVFQGFNLIPTLTALENVLTALTPLRIGRRAARERAVAALEAVGLGERLDHLPGELSGGQQQRVAIARALVKEPDVLLADEPTGNLDEDTRDEIIGLLEGLWRERGLTLVVVTHDSAVAARAQRRLRIKGGTVSEAA